MYYLFILNNIKTIIFIFYFIDFIIALFIIFILFMILWWKTILTGFVRFTNYTVLECNSKLSNR